MAENPESPKKFDEIEWDEYEAAKEPTSFLVRNRRTSVGKNLKNDQKIKKKIIFEIFKR